MHYVYNIRCQMRYSYNPIVNLFIRTRTSKFV